VTEPRLRIVYWERAAKQIEKANDWWRAHRPAAPDAISEDLVEILDLLSVQPGLGLPATNVKLPGVRRVLLKRVGYYLYYRVSSTLDTLELLAFWHSRRRTRPQL
jgi:hypothetical protein